MQCLRTLSFSGRLALARAVPVVLRPAPRYHALARSVYAWGPCAHGRPISCGDCFVRITSTVCQCVCSMLSRATARFLFMSATTWILWQGFDRLQTRRRGQSFPSKRQMSVMISLAIVLSGSLYTHARLSAAARSHVRPGPQRICLRFFSQATARRAPLGSTRMQSLTPPNGMPAALLGHPSRRTLFIQTADTPNPHSKKFYPGYGFSILEEPFGVCVVEILAYAFAC